MTDKRKFSSLETPESDAAGFEDKYVHKIYEKISDHFSATRYKAWPRVAEFVAESGEEDVVVDVGSGNGKSLAGVIGTKRTLIACDASRSLLQVAAEKGIQSVTCNALSIPLKSEVANVVICIAMLHHLSTHDRRIAAVTEMTRLLTPGGRMLIYVWSSTQRRFKNSTSQDVSVPWTMNKRFSNTTQSAVTKASKKEEKEAKNEEKEATEAPEEVHQRYYHLFNEGELEGLMSSLPLKIVKSYYDCDNWCVIAEKTTQKKAT
eukprot:TRINITY_DN665_c5_g1_i1.p1 TRINITY_DN665_c5_g1~~TRINITY_DN665_c5_g1_i1.p1  ORF type:complete len:262 (+),score=44.28 TRINITY_DN665_c5_g1_i1:66-851(+)